MRLRIPTAIVFFLTLFPVAGKSQGLAPRPFQGAERWCALGDSITEGGGYHQHAELFFMTRTHTRPVDLINCGIRGNTATGANERLSWDCLDSKPTVVSVMLGMNDVGRSFFKYQARPDFAQKALERAESYEREMRTLARSLSSSGAKVIFIKPSIFDDTADLTTPNLPGCGAALKGYGDIVSEIAEQSRFMVVDFSSPMKAINQHQQKLNPHFLIVGPDRVHPTTPGYFVMAYEFLKAMNSPGIVSHLRIDAATGTIGRADNCEVTELKIESAVEEARRAAVPIPHRFQLRSKASI